MNITVKSAPLCVLVVDDCEDAAASMAMLVEVWGHDGVAAWVLIHIEIQSQSQADFALRMFQYHYRLRERFEQGDPGVPRDLARRYNRGRKRECQLTPPEPGTLLSPRRDRSGERRPRPRRSGNAPARHGSAGYR